MAKAFPVINFPHITYSRRKKKGFFPLKAHQSLCLTRDPRLLSCDRRECWRGWGRGRRLGITPPLRPLLQRGLNPWFGQTDLGFHPRILLSFCKTAAASTLAKQPRQLKCPQAVPSYTSSLGGAWAFSRILISLLFRKPQFFTNSRTPIDVPDKFQCLDSPLPTPHRLK